MLKVGLMTLGHIRHRLDIARICGWKSKVFRVQRVADVPNLADSLLGWQTYNDEEFDNLRPNADVDLTIAVTEHRLQANYYARLLPNNLVVLSLYEVADLCHAHSVPIENHIIKNIYELCVIKLIYTTIPVTSQAIPKIIHDETRSCLFDMNGLKSDLLHSATRPVLCTQCRAYLSRIQTPHGLLECLDKELKKIRRPLHYRVITLIKQYPLVSLLLSFVAGIVMQILGSLVYESLKMLVGIGG